MHENLYGLASIVIALPPCCHCNDDPGRNVERTRVCDAMCAVGLWKKCLHLRLVLK
jgi:hypothetical protein